MTITRNRSCEPGVCVPPSDKNNASSATSVQAVCRKCSAAIFVGYNAWLRATRTYYLPALADSYKISGLVATGEPRPASDGTELSECQIQPLSCSSCDETLGIVCTATPDRKTRFKHREFLKLPRIVLLSSLSGSEIDPVVIDAMLEEPRSDAAHVESDSRRVDSPSVSAITRDGIPPAVHSRAMDTAQRRTASPIQLPSIVHSTQNTQPYPPHDDRYSHLQLQLQHHSGILEDQRRLLDDTRQYIGLIEEQRREIEDTRQHLVRVERAIETLHREQGNIIAVVNEVRAGVNARHGASERADNAELDILAERLQHVSAQANEVEGLKMQVDIMRRQLRRIESRGSPAAQSVEPAAYEHAHAPHAQPPLLTQTPSQPERAPFYQTPSETRLPPPIMANTEPRNLEHPAPADNRSLPGFRSIETAPPVVSSWRPAGAPSGPPPGPPPGAPPGAPSGAPSGAPPGEFAPAQASPAIAPPTSAPQAEPQAASGWAAVNSSTGVKRSENPSTYESPLPGSPKRQKLAPLMPRTEQNPTSASSPYFSGVTSESLPPVPSLLRGPSNDSQGSVHTSNNLRFVQFAQHDAPQEEAWYQENHRSSADSGARGSPRRGRGGRGRGGRKSGGHDGGEHGSPGYDRTVDWSTVAQATTTISGYGTMNTEMGTLVTPRSNGLGGPSDRPSEVPDLQQVQPLTASLYPDPHFMPITTTADVASSTQPTKKTRTKPIRNSEGILIRKDGRPDMRSVSSAMNLKKVHAKKEAERFEKAKSTDDDKGAVQTPQSNSEHEGNGDMSVDSPGTPSMDRDLDGGDGYGTQDKHEKIVRKIFPNGIPDGPRNMAQQFFPRPEESRIEVKVETAHDTNLGAVAKQSPKDAHDDSKKHEREVNQGPMPLLDGDRSMVDHDSGDIEMDEPKE